MNNSSNTEEKVKDEATDDNKELDENNEVEKDSDSNETQNNENTQADKNQGNSNTNNGDNGGNNNGSNANSSTNGNSSSHVANGNNNNTNNNNQGSNVVKNNLVSYNGALKVSGTKIVNQYGETIVLKGMSSHGLQWFGDFINQNNIKVLRDEWHSNVFRVAMYTNENGYISNRSLRDTLISKVDMIIQNDMYVIIDWHILSDGNPLTYKNEAKEFFDYVSKRYANVPNVIFEICNEPNGGVNWNDHIKPYADEVISVIRKNNKNAIIIVGTANWSQKVLEPVNNRINDSNVMYALHFYAGTHKDYLRNEAKQAISAGLPIFVSEWGTSAADGNGGVYLDEAQKWIDFMNSYNISWCNWSLNNKNESSALLNPGAGINDMNNLSASGRFVKAAMQK